MPRLASLNLLALLLLPARAESACENVSPVACPECFAVAVIPDTQKYTTEDNQEFVGGHLGLITEYLCDNKDAWTEPSTGKQMPILLAIHEGDLVHNGDEDEAQPLAEWARIDLAYDNLDACNLRYLVTVGNHDYEGGGLRGRYRRLPDLLRHRSLDQSGARLRRPERLQRR